MDRSEVNTSRGGDTRNIRSRFAASKPSSNKSSLKGSGSNKSSLKPLSVSSMLRQNLTANDDTRQLQVALRRQDIDDINFKREDADVKYFQAINDLSRRREAVKPNMRKKVQRTH